MNGNNKQHMFRLGIKLDIENYNLTKLPLSKFQRTIASTAGKIFLCPERFKIVREEVCWGLANF